MAEDPKPVFPWWIFTLIAVPALIRCSEDQEYDVRQMAEAALRRIGRPAENAVPALIELLKDPKDGIRQRSASSLGNTRTSRERRSPRINRVFESRECRTSRGCVMGAGTDRA